MTEIIPSKETRRIPTPEELAKKSHTEVTGNVQTIHKTYGETWHDVSGGRFRVRELPLSPATQNRDRVMLIETLAVGQDPATGQQAEYITPIAATNVLTHYNDPSSPYPVDPRNAWTRGVVDWNELLNGDAGNPAAAPIDGELFQRVKHITDTLTERINEQRKAARSVGKAASEAVNR